MDKEKFVVVWGDGYYYLRFFDHTVVMLKEEDLFHLLKAVEECQLDKAKGQVEGMGEQFGAKSDEA